MKLKRVVIKNFRSIKHLEFEFLESNLLVGPNNSGKSNIIGAINLICGEDWVNPEKLQDYDFYLRDKGKEIRIELIFDNGFSAVFFYNPSDSSNLKWRLDYKDNLGNFIRGNIKEDFPSTYLLENSM